jgi:flagellar biosynthesis/type III secretory pathway protein FliH
MGAGRTLQRALVGLERLPEGARERHVALPALLEYRAALFEQPTRTPEDEEFLMDTQDIVQRLKDEGRDEGRREGRDEGRREGRHEAMQNNLLTIYRTRFGSVPRKVRAAVERTRDDAALAKWIEIFVARSAVEIVAAVAGKKA